MYLEICSAANLIVHLIRLARSKRTRWIDDDDLQNFYNALVEIFLSNFRRNWCPKQPWKGFNYRIIRFNPGLNALVCEAGKKCNLSPQYLCLALPNFLTIWINPLKVCYSIGTKYNIIYEYKEGITEPWKPTLNTGKKEKLYKIPKNM